MPAVTLFAEAGAYERLVGRARFAVDPDAPAQAGIVDVAKTPRNRDGLVEFAADLCILKPVDPARGKQAALLRLWQPRQQAGGAVF